jgi:hypothetical protein
MLSDRCLSFRENFETGTRDPHAETCPPCRAWVDEISRLRDFGTDLPLSERLRRRLENVHPERDRSWESDSPAGVGTVGAFGMPLPQIPVPIDLRQRLRRIPAERGDGVLPRWVSRSRDLLAACCLLAMVLTAALGSPSPETLKTARSVSRDVTLKVQEAGTCGTRTLIGMGDALSRAFVIANQSMGDLMGRLGTHRRETSEPSAEKAPSAKAPTTQNKENPHGKRTDPRSGASPGKSNG